MKKRVEGPDIYILPLTGKPEQQQFTIQSGVLTSTSSRRRGAISGRPLPERTDFGPAIAAPWKRCRWFACMRACNLMFYLLGSSWSWSGHWQQGMCH